MCEILNVNKKLGEPAKPQTTSVSWNLIRWTKCNATCLSILKENKVLSDEDEAELESIKNELKKSRKLYQLLLTKKGWYPHLISALKEDCRTGALKILKKLGREEEVANCFGATGAVQLSKQGKSYKSPIRFDVIGPVLNFTGREPQLFELHQKLQENMEKGAVLSQIASVVGLGGIGKTELARKYIQKYGEEFYDGNVIWIIAKTEETLGESFRRLASNHLNISLINVDKKEVDNFTIVCKVYSHFSEKRALFVFDNAESTEHLLNFMPFHLSSSANSPYILITSRDREWSFSVRVLELDEMTEEDAIRFVKTSLEMENDDDYEDMMRLVNRLQRYPLALSQAVSFIKQRQFLGNFSIYEYLVKFEENSAKLLDSKKPPAEFNSYRETTLTTWRVTTQHISADEENGRCAMEILNSISYFLPDKIPMKVFAKLSDGDEYQEALHLLVKYSMLNVRRGDKTINVHRLVQEVGRIQLRANNEEEQALRIALQLVSCSMKYGFGEELVYHAVSTYKFTSVLNPELSAEFKHLPWKIIKKFNRHFRNEEAEPVGKELEDLLSKIVPPEDPDLFRLKFALIITASRNEDNLESRLEELVQLHKIYVKNKENCFSLNELLAVECLSAMYLKKLGRYQEALQLSRKIFGQQKLHSGKSNWRTIDTLVRLAECIWKLRTSKTFEDGTELSFAISVINEAHKSNLELVGKDFKWTDTIVSAAVLLYDIHDKDYAINILNVVMKRIRESQDKHFLAIEIRCMALLSEIKRKMKKYDEWLAACQSLHSKLVTWKGEKDELTLLAQGKVAKAILGLNKNSGNKETAVTF